MGQRLLWSLPVLGLGAFGTVTFVEGIRLSVGSWRAPGPGLFPVVVGGLLAVTALASLLIRVEAGEDGAQGGPGRALVGFLLVCGYVAALPWLGFALASFGLLVLWLRLIGARPWATSMATGVLVAVAVTDLFGRVFQVPLPRPFLFG